MRTTTNSTSSQLLQVFQLTKKCILLPFLLSLSFVASANANTLEFNQVGKVIGGAIDEPLYPAARGSGKQQAKKPTRNQKALAKQVRKEQQALAKLSRNAVKAKAEKGERLAQVVLANDFATEAQLLTFAPAAANAALSDALRWYALAAKRGYPGAPSLDASGVSFQAIRVVRNK